MERGRLGWLASVVFLGGCGLGATLQRTPDGGLSQQLLVPALLAGALLVIPLSAKRRRRLGEFVTPTWWEWALVFGLGLMLWAHRPAQPSQISGGHFQILTIAALAWATHYPLRRHRWIAAVATGLSIATYFFLRMTFNLVPG